MSIFGNIVKEIDIAAVWISKVSTYVEGVFSREAKLLPAEANALQMIVVDTEDFLAAATPAVAGEGLNFPADSVVYAKFVKLVTDWEQAASLLKQAASALKAPQALAAVASQGSKGVADPQGIQGVAGVAGILPRQS